MKKYLWILLVLWANSMLAQSYGDYYQTAEGLKSDALKTALNTIIKGHTEFTYTSGSTDVWDILKKTDQDPDNEANVILIYSGASVNAAQEYNNANGWTREHVWAKSRGNFGTEIGPGTDVHHLRPEDAGVNSARNNRSFDNCQNCEEVSYNGVFTGSYTDKYEWTFEPRDEVKGDVARMIFYMATRYEGENGEPDLELTESLPSLSDTSPFHGRLSTLISWNREDPVSDWERNRNEIIYALYQNNRNPFIDYPELVEYIWGNAVNATWSSKFGTSPKNGETNVLISTSIQFIFAEAIQNIDNSEITDANVNELLSLKETDVNGIDIPFTATINVDKKIITIIPNSEFNYLQTYYAAIGDVENSDESLIGSTEINFTTIEEDITAPSFVSYPTNGDIDVDIFTSITVTFDEPVRNLDDSEITNLNVADLLTLKENDANGTEVSFTATIDENKKIITATPSSELKSSQIYYAAIETVEDASNNVSSANNMTFTTATELLAARVIISQYYEGASNDKYIEISNVGSSSVDLSTYYLGRFSNTDSPADSDIYSDGDPLSGSIGAGQTFLYKNPGAVNPAYASTGAVGSTTATYFNGDDAIALMNGGNTWQHRVDCLYSSITNGLWGAEKSFYRKETVTGGNKNISVLDGSGEWTEVSLALVASADQESIEYLGTHTSGSSTEEDVTAPVFTSLPGNNAENILVNTSITLTFDEAIRNIDNSEISDDNIANLITIRESNKDGTTISFSGIVNETKNIITITPSADLSFNQVYYVNIAPIEDFYDNATVASEFSFTTISADTELPFWSLDFETPGGYSTSVAEFTDFDGTTNGWDYFLRTDGSNIGSEIEFTNKLGSFYFAAQDIDGEGASLPVELNIDDINISGKIISAFSVYLAEDKATDGSFDWDKVDYVKFQYDVDNSGTFADLFWIYGDGSTYNSQPSIDTDFDGVGDGTNMLTSEFKEITTAIDISGTTLDIKVIFNLNAGDEDIAIDNLSLIENDLSTSVDGIDAKEISVYPNPNNGKFIVQLSSALKANARIEVYNVMGKLVHEMYVNQQKTEIDLRAMKNGIYFVRIFDGEIIVTQKIVIQ